MPPADADTADASASADQAPIEETPVDPATDPKADQGPPVAPLAPPAEDVPPRPDQAAPAVDAELRDKVAEATDALEPGQTVTTGTNGTVTVTGTPKPSEVEPGHTLGDVGSFLAVETPLGRVLLGFETDADGQLFVTATCESFNPDYVVETDTILLRSGA